MTQSKETDVAKSVVTNDIEGVRNEGNLQEKELIAR